MEIDQKETPQPARYSLSIEEIKDIWEAGSEEGAFMWDTGRLIKQKPTDLETYLKTKFGYISSGK